MENRNHNHKNDMRLYIFLQRNQMSRIMKKLTITILIGICMILSTYARNSMVIRVHPLKTMTGHYDSNYLHVPLSEYTGQVIIRITKTETAIPVLTDTCEISSTCKDVTTRIADLLLGTYTVELELLSGRERFEGIIMIGTPSDYYPKYQFLPNSSKKIFNLKRE